MTRLIFTILALLASGCSRQHLVPFGQRWSPGPFDGSNVTYQHGPPWCYSDTASATRFLLWKLQAREGTPAERVATGSNPSQVVDVPGDVDLVHDEAICQHISSLLDSTVFDKPRGQAVLVFTVPSTSKRFVGQYAVIPEPLQLGEYSPVLEVSADFRLYAGVHLY